MHFETQWLSLNQSDGMSEASFYRETLRRETEVKAKSRNLLHDIETIIYVTVPLPYTLRDRPVEAGAHIRWIRRLKYCVKSRPTFFIREISQKMWGHLWGDVRSGHFLGLFRTCPLILKHRSQLPACCTIRHGNDMDSVAYSGRDVKSFYCAFHRL